MSCWYLDLFLRVIFPEAGPTAVSGHDCVFFVYPWHGTRHRNVCSGKAVETTLMIVIMIIIMRWTSVPYSGS